MFNVKQGNYWYHFYNLIYLWYDAVLDWGLNPGPPALEANTLPLGYQGGGKPGIVLMSYVYLPNIKISQN